MANEKNNHEPNDRDDHPAAIARHTLRNHPFALGCYGEVDADPAYYPPASYVVTAQPVYYEGHASYWYGGRWVYRDGASWNYYRSEPAYLGARRGNGAPPRRVYERPAPPRGRR
jgi:hypothetical protein